MIDTETSVFDTSPFMVALDDDQKKMYAALHRLEGLWIDACVKNGCNAVLVGNKTQRYLVINQIDNLPESVEIERLASELSLSLKATAKSQGKSTKIGTRSLEPIFWLTPYGRFKLEKTPLDDDIAVKILHSQVIASRGAYQPVQVALNWLENAKSAMEIAIVNSKANHQHNRAEAQATKLISITSQLEDVKVLIAEYRAENLLFKFTSGVNDKYRVFAASGANHCSTVGRIALVFGAQDIELKESPKRERQTRHAHLSSLGNMRFYLRTC